MALDRVGNAYVADFANHTIRKITPDGTVSTLAGSAGEAGSADGTGAAARFNQVHGVAVDGAGNIYAADFGNHTIRKITSDGVVTTLAGLAENPGSTDGEGAAARFSAPYDVAVDETGNVYVADTSNHTIRKITPAGMVSTLAGVAGNVGSTDGIGGEAKFAVPGRGDDRPRRQRLCRRFRQPGDPKNHAGRRAVTHDGNSGRLRLTRARSKSIAVLPFADLSPQRDQQYFSDGIAEEILNALAHVKDLKVAGRSSSFSFRGKDAGSAQHRRSARRRPHSRRLGPQAGRQGPHHRAADPGLRRLPSLVAKPTMAISAMSSVCRNELRAPSPINSRSSCKASRSRGW